MKVVVFGFIFICILHIGCKVHRDARSIAWNTYELVTVRSSTVHSLVGGASNNFKCVGFRWFIHRLSSCMEGNVSHCWIEGELTAERE